MRLKSCVIIGLFIIHFIQGNTQIMGSFQPVGNEGLLIPRGFAINSQGERFAAECEKVSRWDGNNWVPFQEGFNGPIGMLSFDSQDNLYVGGNFDSLQGMAANHIVKWDGSGWTSLGSGLVYEPEFMDFDQQDNLYTATERELVVRKWNGSAWDTVGGSIGINVTALLVDQQGDVYTGNRDTQGAGSVNIMNHWDGNSWSTVFSSNNGDYVNSLAMDSQGTIYIGGEFKTANGKLLNNVAQWDGAELTALGNGITKGSGFRSNVEDIDVDLQGRVYVGGAFGQAGDTTANNIAYWDGNQWFPLGSINNNGTNDDVSTMLLDPNGDLYVFGSFDSVSTLLSPFIAIWANNAWIAFGQVIANGGVFSILSSGTNSLYVGGAFSFFMGSDSRVVSKWDGATWSSMNNGLDSSVYAVVSLGIDEQETLYAGTLDEEGNHIIKWDGSVWSTLGDSLDYQFATDLELDDDGNLYAIIADGFDDPGEVRKWSGTTWSVLDSNTFNASFYGFQDLAIKDNGEIWATFYYTNQGSPERYGAAKWSGTVWEIVGGLADNSIECIAFDAQGDAYIGGFFTSIAGNTISRIAKWNGSMWTALGNGLSPYITDIEFDDSGYMYASGDELEVNGEKTGFAIWDGNTWNAPTPSLNYTCDYEFLNIETKPGGGIYLGGFFQDPYPLIAAWSSDSLNTDIDEYFPFIKLSLFPNPTQGYLTIESPNVEITSVSLFDTAGRRVSAEITYGWNKTLVQTDYKGLAILMIQTKSGMTSRKVLFE